MARKASKSSAASAGVNGQEQRAPASPKPNVHYPAAHHPNGHGGNNHMWSGLFSRMAFHAAHWMGKPVAFLVAVLVVVIWALTGPMFGYSDTWQLVINTSTTIVTFLMVFLIQNTQNRDAMAVQLKLSELIIAVQGAENRLATAEDMTEEDLEKLHEEYRRCADVTLEHINRRRQTTPKHAD